MPPPLDRSYHFDRRRLLKGIGLAALAPRFSPVVVELTRELQRPHSRDGAPEFADVRYQPRYPARTVIDEVLTRLRPGSDEFVSEGYAADIEALMRVWADALKRHQFQEIATTFATGLQASSFVPVRQHTVRSGSLDVVRQEYGPAVAVAGETVAAEFERWLPASFHVLSAVVEVTALEVLTAEPLLVRTEVRYTLVATAPQEVREQRVGTWRMDWARSIAEPSASRWQLTRWQAGSEERSTLHGPAFVDITEQALGSNPSYTQQMLHGADEWRTRLDGASGIDVYGNNGVTAGDYDGDGWDDLYVCQPAGLPNRLYRNRGDGTFEDVTEKAGVGVLDNTACALFADFRNIGRQDLLVVCGTGPLLFLNGGDGTFTRKLDAFRFLRPPEGTFTHAAIADYDRDGHLDIYFCLYSYYLGLDQYHYPTPYFDARNGPPNFLFHNQGDGTFVDRTEAAGLNAENDRYSFACAWGEINGDGLQDLYVVNDFGRNNLYRNRGDGTFQAVSEAARVQDVGAGMSAAWTDYDNDGHADLYVADMWSAAGQRVSRHALFHEKSSEPIRALYHAHAGGNALYRNNGNGTFTNVAEQASAATGRWAWCSDFFDFDHDGFADLYVANGYITAPKSGSNATRPDGTPEDARGIDLGSFFWRQVVAKSSDDATPSLAYEHGWNALNELIRTDYSWSGSERNVLFANNRDGTFSDVSGALALNFLEDARSFSLADLDGDGRLEIVLKNRNAPQLRVLRNSLRNIGRSISFRLTGTKSNRDAVGAAITLHVGTLQQTRSLQAGSGFLAQHSKEVFFGVGQPASTLSATVRWPSGLVQHVEGLPADHRIHLTEGVPDYKATPFRPTQTRDEASATKRVERAPHDTAVQIWLLDPLKAPSFTLPDLSGTPRSLASTQGRVTLLHFWSVTAAACTAQLQLLQGARSSLQGAGLELLTINVDRDADAQRARDTAEKRRYAFPVLIANDEVAGIYNLVFRYLCDRRRNLPLPGSFLIDRNGMIVKVYEGTVTGEQLLADARSIPTTQAQRLAKALPFPGTLHDAQFTRNDFTYGVAMFQHGYLDQAAESFEQALANKPNNAEAYYNLGTLNLRRNRLPEARQYLLQTLQRKPDYPEAWNNLGMIAGQQGQTDEAIQNFRKSLALRPSYTTALLNLGNIYRRQHAWADAQEALSRAQALQPDDPEIQYSLGMLYAQQNQSAKAADYLRSAIALRHDYPEALNNLGVLLVRDKNYSEAEQQFLTCIRLVPAFSESYVNLARLYVLQHDRQKARETLQALLRVKPGDAAALNGIAALDAMH